MQNNPPLKNHYLLNVTSEVKAICKPLMQHLGIKHFCYAKNYADGSCILLTITPESIENIRDNFSAGFSEDGSYVTDGFYFQCDMINKGLVPEEYFKKFTERFGASHHLIFYEHYDNYVEQWCFGVAPEQEFMYDVYKQNLDLFEKFMLYFKDKAHKLIQEGERHRIILPKTPVPHLEENEFQRMRENFLNDVQHNYYFFDIKNGGVFISEREYDVIYCLSRGKTLKEIGKALELSPRTIESHLSHVKSRLGFSTRAEIIEKFYLSQLGKKKNHATR